MPYIKQDRREEIETALTETSDFDVRTPGELSYVLTRCVVMYLDNRCHELGISEPDYFLLNEAVGVLVSAKDEFVRRIVAPYEDRKRVEHGDVYDAYKL